MEDKLDNNNPKSVLTYQLDRLNQLLPTKLDLSDRPCIILRNLATKYIIINRSILALDKVSTLTGFILARAAWEITLDTTYLVLENREELYNRYYIFGLIDALKMHISGILTLGFLSRDIDYKAKHEEIQAQFEDNEELYKQFFESKYNKTLKLFSQSEKWDCFSKDFYTELLGIWSGIFSWREKQVKKLYELAEYLDPVVVSSIPMFNNELGKFKLFSDSIEYNGNSAVHSSISHISACAERNDSGIIIDPANDTNTDLIFYMATQVFEVMEWALNRSILINHETPSCSNSQR